MAWAAALAPLVSQGLQLAMQPEQDAHQINQQSALDALQYGYQTAGMDYGLNLQEKLWDYTNYPNQVKQLEAAGLNPALEYGKGGGGGATAAGPSFGGVGGAQAPQGNNGLEGGQLGIQAAEAMADISLKKVQEANIEADTKKKETEVPNIEANTQGILQGINNQKAAEALTKAQTEAQNLANNITVETTPDQIQQVGVTLSKSIAETTSAMVQAGIDQSTIKDKMTIIQQTAIGSVLSNLQLKAQTKLTGAQTANTQANTTMTQAETKNVPIQGNLLREQISKTSNDIQYSWEQLSVDQKQQKADQLYKEGIIDIGQKELLIQSLNSIFSAFSKTGGAGAKPPVGFTQRW